MLNIIENCSLKLRRAKRDTGELARAVVAQYVCVEKRTIGVEKQPSGINIEWNGKASLSRRHRRRTVC